MGRKSLAEERRAEILAAFERCIVRYGIDVSLERIAEEAGVQRSLIRHYLGNREEVVEQLIERIAAEYPRDLAACLTAPQVGTAAQMLDYLFSETVAAPDWDTLITAVVSTAQDRFPQAKQHIVEMMQAIIALVAARLEAFFPQAPPELCYEVAYSVLCLVQTNESMIWLGLQRRHTGMARASAEVLIRRLEGVVRA
jgi:AcrR family transcriptional regulator